jgi:hypothetical protein
MQWEKARAAPGRQFGAIVAGKHLACTGLGHHYVLYESLSAPLWKAVLDVWAIFLHHSLTRNRSVILRLDNVSFAGNTAGTNADGAGNGGALAVTNGAVETVSVTSTSNTAGQYGGAFYLDGTASLHSTESTWRNNALRRPGADGQHIYAAAGAGEWRFAGNTKFDHAAAGTSGLAAAQIDGVVGLDSASVRVSCPPGCVQSEKSEWVDPFLATSDDWSLGEGQAVTTTTNWIFVHDRPPRYDPLPPNITVRNKTSCEELYFQNYLCGNPPPIYVSLCIVLCIVG